MDIRNNSQKLGDPTVTIQVAGKLLQGHLSYLNQLVESACECGLWPVLSLSRLEELDQSALSYLMKGEGHEFTIVSCPDFIRTWMDHERQSRAA
jgi:hypothetical protein